MIKKIKPALIILMHILFLQGALGQLPKNIPEYLNQKFLNYTALVPREEIYVHSDRGEYISGENLWFNIYLLDRQTLKPSSECRIAYFELLNPENRPIVQKKILLTEGIGPGQIILPDTLSTGTYTIRAYTSWMKNFLPYNCYTRNIRIYNAFNNKVYRGKMSSSAALNSGNNDKPYVSAGLTLKSNNLKPDRLEIDIITTEKYRTDNSDQFYLFIQTHGIINHNSSERASDDITKLSIPKNQLTPGINQITVFDSKGQPVAERYIYTTGKKTPEPVIHSADSAGLRNKVSLDLEFGKGLSNAFNSSDFSVSVEPVSKSLSKTDIADYMIFGTEFGSLPGMLRDKEINSIPAEVVDSLLQKVKSNWINWNKVLADQLPVFKYKKENSDHYLSGRLSVQKETGSDRFVLLSPPGKVPVFQYAKTDKDGNFSFAMRIDDKTKDVIVQPDAAVKNGAISIESPFSDQYLNSAGGVDTANREIPEYISRWSINQQVRKIYGISSIGNSLPVTFSYPGIKRFYGKPDIELYMKDYIALPVMEEVFFELLAGVSLKNKKTGYEIAIADPNNNKKAFDFPPALFIDGVLIKNAGIIAALEPERVEKIDVINGKYSVGDYLFYGIVNVITKPGDFSIPPLSDDAIRLSYRVIDPSNAFVSPDYSSPDKKKSRIPDFRNTLYWNPSVKTDGEGKANVEFWTSDFVSDFVIDIQGITPEGKIFSLKKTIRVRR